MMSGTNAEITLFHVVGGLDHSIPDAREILQQAEKTAEPLLQDATSRLPEAGVNGERIVPKLVTAKASPAKAIVEEAQREGYGTIFVGRRGVSGAKEFCMGRA
jgi:nucleotide-binding universal stress UspA family protein